MTTLTLDDRWHYALRDALIKSKKWHLPLIQKIRDYLFIKLNLVNGDLQRNGIWNWKKIHAILEKGFERKVKRICFTDKSLRFEERKYIEENNLVEDGLNVKKGGEGGPAIDLPMIFIARLISYGNTISKINKSVREKYNIQCTLQTVRNRIIDYWESFNHAQIIFLKPILEMLIKARFKLYEINEVYNRFMLERIKLFFGGNSYRVLLEMTDEDWSKVEPLEPFPLWTRAGIPKVIIPVTHLKYLIRKYLYAIEAVNDHKVQTLLSVYSSARQNIVYQIQQQLDYKDWNEAREEIAFPYLIKELRKRKRAPEKIYEDIGYKPISAKSHTTLSRALFFGLSTIEVQNFLHKYPSIETLKVFKEVLFEGRKKSSSLSKDTIDDLLLRYISSKDAVKELTGYHTGDFLKEVRKYYSKFKSAKWIVKGPFVISELRNLPNNYEREDLITISEIS